MPVDKTAIYFNKSAKGDLSFDILDDIAIFYDEDKKKIRVIFQATGSKNPPDVGSPAQMPSEKRIIKGNISRTKQETHPDEFDTVEYKTAQPTLTYIVDNGTLTTSNVGHYFLEIDINPDFT